MGRGWVNGIREAQGAKKGKLFTKIAREIAVAAKLGGANPDSNARLRMALKDARENSMPKDTIDRALKRGSGQDSETQYEESIYEGYGPHGVAMLVETLTDNKNRTVQELRAQFARGGGNLGEPGSVQWMFERVGQIIAEPTKPGIDAEEAAINAGADEASPIEGTTQVLFRCAPTDVDAVQETLGKEGWKILKYELSYKAKNAMEITPEQEKDLQDIMERLEDIDDVKKLHLAL